jgi:hypothetical protein
VSEHEDFVRQGHYARATVYWCESRRGMAPGGYWHAKVTCDDLPAVSGSFKLERRELAEEWATAMWRAAEGFRETRVTGEIRGSVELGGL